MVSESRISPLDGTGLTDVLASLLSTFQSLQEGNLGARATESTPSGPGSAHRSKLTTTTTPTPGERLNMAQSTLLTTVLTTVVGMVSGNVRMQTAFHNSNGIPALLYLLGWSSSSTTASTSATTTTETKNGVSDAHPVDTSMTADVDYHIKMLCLIAIRELSYKQPALLATMVGHAAFDRVMEFMLWTYVSFDSPVTSRSTKHSLPLFKGVPGLVPSSPRSQPSVLMPAVGQPLPRAPTSMTMGTAPATLSMDAPAVPTTSGTASTSSSSTETKAATSSAASTRRISLTSALGPEVSLDEALAAEHAAATVIEDREALTAAHMHCRDAHIGSDAKLAEAELNNEINTGLSSIADNGDSDSKERDGEPMTLVEVCHYQLRCNDNVQHDATMTLLSRSPQFDCIFDVLYSMALLPQWPQRDRRPEERVHLDECVLRAVLNVFDERVASSSTNNRQARALMLQALPSLSGLPRITSSSSSSTSTARTLCLPLLQQYTLVLLQRVLIAKPELLGFIRDQNPYPTFFSSFFFLLPDQLSSSAATVLSTGVSSVDGKWSPPPILSIPSTPRFSPASMEASSISVSVDDTRLQTMLAAARLLRRQVLDFVLIMATYDDTVNLHECAALLTALQRSADNDEAVIALVRASVSALVMRRTKTQQALTQANFMAIISRLMQDQQVAYKVLNPTPLQPLVTSTPHPSSSVHQAGTASPANGSPALGATPATTSNVPLTPFLSIVPAASPSAFTFGISSSSSSTPSVSSTLSSVSSSSRPRLAAARFAVLRLLDHYLSTGDTRLHTLKDPTAIDTIFSLLRESSPMRELGLRLTTSLMIEVGPDFGKPDPRDRHPQGMDPQLVMILEKAKRSMFSKYVDLLPRVLEEPHTLKTLLCGIRRVLGTHTRLHQDIFRRRQCFIHLINILTHVASTMELINITAGAGRVIPRYVKPKSKRGLRSRPRAAARPDVNSDTDLVASPGQTPRHGEGTLTMPMDVMSPGHSSSSSSMVGASLMSPTGSMVPGMIPSTSMTPGYSVVDNSYVPIVMPMLPPSANMDAPSRSRGLSTESRPEHEIGVGTGSSGSGGHHDEAMSEMDGDQRPSGNAPPGGLSISSNGSTTTGTPNRGGFDDDGEAMVAPKPMIGHHDHIADALSGGDQKGHDGDEGKSNVRQGRSQTLQISLEEFKTNMAYGRPQLPASPGGLTPAHHHQQQPPSTPFHAAGISLHTASAASAGGTPLMRMASSMGRVFGTEVCCAVLQTLTSLMAENKRSQDHFKQNYGYETLAECLLKAEQYQPSRPLYAALFDMLVDGNFRLRRYDIRRRGAGYDEDTILPLDDEHFPKAIIQNPDVIGLIFSPSLLLNSELSQQADIFTVFTAVVARSSLNQSFCCRSHLIDSLLDLFPFLQLIPRQGESSRGGAYKAFGSHSRAPSSNMLPPLMEESLPTSPSGPTPPPPPHDYEKSEHVLAKKTIELIKVLGTHSITVKQLKRFFGLMKSTVMISPAASLLATAAALVAPATPSNVDDSSTSLPVPPDTPPMETRSITMAISPTASTPTTPGAASVPGSPTVPTGSVSFRSRQKELQTNIRPSYGPLLLSAIEEMTNKQGPANFLYFDGITSGLSIPGIDRWPNARGWTFSTWLRIESYAHPIPNMVPKHFHQPRLFRFMTEHGKAAIGLEAYFDQGRLTLQVTRARGSTFIQPIDVALPVKRWFHLAITQSVPPTFGLSELRVYVNSEQKHLSTNVKYPDFSKPLLSCFIGTDNALPRPGALFGQMGPIYIFDDAVTHRQVQMMYARGPSYMFTFSNDGPEVSDQASVVATANVAAAAVTAAAAPSPVATLSAIESKAMATVPSVATSSGSTTPSASAAAATAASKSGLSSRIFLAYNSKARDGSLFLDNTPRSNRFAAGPRRKRGMHALSLPGTYQCVTRHVKDVLHCLGGIRVLFPLFAQLDQPVKVPKTKVQQERAIAERKRLEHEQEMARRAAAAQQQQVIAAIANATPIEGTENTNTVSSPTSEEGKPSTGSGIGAALRKEADSKDEITTVPTTPVQTPTGGPSPSVIAAAALALAEASSHDLVYDVDPRLLVAALRVLAVMVIDNPINQQFMEQADGFGVLASQLEKASAAHFTVATVDAIDQLLRHTAAVSESLFVSAFFHLLVNFRLWIYVEQTTQRAWLRVLGDTIRRHPRLLRTDDGLQRILDQLRCVCWFEAETDSLATQQVMLHPVTLTVTGARPSPEHLTWLRGEVLQLVRYTILEDLSMENIRSVLFYLQATDDERQKVDLLQLLLSLLNTDDNVAQRVLSHLADLEDLAASGVDSRQLTGKALQLRLKSLAGSSRRCGVDTFLDLLSSRLHDVRVLALRLLAKLLRSPSQRVNTAQLFPAIYSLLGGGQPAAAPPSLSEPTYLALFSIMLGEHIDTQNVEAVRHQWLMDPDSKRAQLAHPRVLPVIFKLLRGTSAIPLIQQVMQDLLFLLKSRPDNKRLILDQPGWQTWFFDLMIEPKSDRPEITAAMMTPVPAVIISPAPHAIAAITMAGSSLPNDTHQPSGTPPSGGTSSGHSSTPPRASALPPQSSSSSTTSSVYATPVRVDPTSSAPVTPTPTPPATPSEAKRLLTASAAPGIGITPSRMPLDGAGNPLPHQDFEGDTPMATVQAYAMNLLETVLFHALHKPGGWKGFEKCVNWLAVYSHAGLGTTPPPPPITSPIMSSATPRLAGTAAAHRASAMNLTSLPALLQQVNAANASKGSGSDTLDEEPSVARHRLDLPVLSVTLKLLSNITKLLQREGELSRSNPADFAVLVENMGQVLEQTQALVLSRIYVHAAGRNKRRHPTKQESEADKASVGREMAAVWPLLRVMLQINAWIGEHRYVKYLLRGSKDNKKGGGTLPRGGIPPVKPGGNSLGGMSADDDIPGWCEDEPEYMMTMVLRIALSTSSIHQSTAQLLFASPNVPALCALFRDVLHMKGRTSQAVTAAAAAAAPSVSGLTAGLRPAIADNQTTSGTATAGSVVTTSTGSSGAAATQRINNMITASPVQGTRSLQGGSPHTRSGVPGSTHDDDDDEATGHLLVSMYTFLRHLLELLPRLYAEYAPPGQQLAETSTTTTAAPVLVEVPVPRPATPTDATAAAAAGGMTVLLAPELRPTSSGGTLNIIASPLTPSPAMPNLPVPSDLQALPASALQSLSSAPPAISPSSQPVLSPTSSSSSGLHVRTISSTSATPTLGRPPASLAFGFYLVLDVLDMLQQITIKLPPRTRAKYVKLGQMTTRGSHNDLQSMSSSSAADFTPSLGGVSGVPQGTTLSGRALVSGSPATPSSDSILPRDASGADMQGGSGGTPGKEGSLPVAIVGSRTGPRVQIGISAGFQLPLPPPLPPLLGANPPPFPRDDDPSLISSAPCDNKEVEVFKQWESLCLQVFAESKEWQDMRRELQLPVGEYTQTQHDECQKRIGQFELQGRALQREHQSNEVDEDNMFDKTRAVIENVRNKNRSIEQGRRAIMVMTRTKRRRLEARAWRVIARSLTNERGSWSTYLELPEDQRPRVYWKLDETENRSRMRPKLKINYQGTDHKQASQYYYMDVRQQKQLEAARRAAAAKAAANNAPGTDTGEKKTTGHDDDTKHDEDADWDLLAAGNKEDDKDSKLMVGGSVASEEPVLEVECSMVSIIGVTRGDFTITTTHVYFVPKPPKVEEKKKTRSRAHIGYDKVPMPEAKERKWPIAEMKAIHPRLYLLRPRAIEIFFEDTANFFFHFDYPNQRQQVLSKLNRLVRQTRARLQSSIRSTSTKGAGALPGGRVTAAKSYTYDYHGGTVPLSEVVRRSGIQLAWQQRKISNFDYLMHLNTIAGRSYNDLAQYPVFPWVIADYESERLDLNNPETAHITFRDLRKPMGALNQDRLENVILTRYENSGDEEGNPKFHYGTHYSNPAAVLFYLVRMEPFTTQAIALQDGRFDQPDRMFHSMAMTYKGCLTNPADVKELIPEMFYLPELFRNANAFDMGIRQRGDANGDVLLPPWAKTAEDFVRINREALESEYVSNNLHHWIDIIFGYRQRGQAAIDSFNVFHYLTYEGDHIDREKDPGRKLAKMAQIAEWGQTPRQVFTDAHPQRYCAEDIISSVFCRLQDLQLYVVQKVTAKASIDNPLLFIQHTTERILTVGLDRILSIHKWRNSTPEYVPPFAFEAEKKKSKPRRIGVHFAVGLNILPFFFAVSNCERYLLSCGHWDNSFRVSTVDTGVLVHSVSQHKDIVTCMDIAESGDILVTGSKDTTVMVWQVGDRAAIVLANAPAGTALVSSSSTSAGIEPYIVERPLHILYGHDDEVTCVAVNTDLDIVVSGSKDGTCIIHNVRKGRYVRSIYPPNGGALRWVGISSQGLIVTYSLVCISQFLFSLSLSFRYSHVSLHCCYRRIYVCIYSQ
jgi:hypothetical protein